MRSSTPHILLLALASSRHHRFRSGVTAATLITVGLALTACGASSAHGTLNAGSPATHNAASNTPTSDGSDTSATSQGEPLAPIGCGAIPIAQANALISTPITKIDYSPDNGTYYADHHFTCDAGMQIDVYPQDTSKDEYTADLADENATATPIPGIADSAVFTQSGLIVQGAGPMPDVYVHKDNATCEIKTSSTVTDYNVPVISNGLSQGVSTQVATAWAAKAAGLCTVIFTAIKA